MIFHFGTFQKAVSLANGLSIAHDALQKNHFQVFIPSKQLGHSIVGGNNNVTVTVICVPEGGGLAVTVIAASPDSATAEQARNSVRETIVKTVIID